MVFYLGDFLMLVWVFCWFDVIFERFSICLGFPLRFSFGFSSSLDDFFGVICLTIWGLTFLDLKRNGWEEQMSSSRVPCGLRNGAGGVVRRVLVCQGCGGGFEEAIRLCFSRTLPGFVISKLPNKPHLLKKTEETVGDFSSKKDQSSVVQWQDDPVVGPATSGASVAEPEAEEGEDEDSQVVMGCGE